MADNADVTGQIWRQYPNQVIGCRSLVPDGFNDKASFAWNNTKPIDNSGREFHMILWKDSRCETDPSSYHIDLRAGQKWYGNSSSGSHLNDQFSAVSVHYW